MQILQAIPNVYVLADVDGRQAKESGLLTSGCVALYDRQGELHFYGGITSARGHEGDCLGTQALRAIVSGNQPPTTRTPVFGCTIFKAAE